MHARKHRIIVYYPLHVFLEFHDLKVFKLYVDIKLSFIVFLSFTGVVERTGTCFINIYIP